MTTNIDHFNQDELEAPTWMNRKFFTKVLQNSEKDDSISVSDLKITPASMKGDHYFSVMFRAEVEYSNAREQTQTISMIIKTMPELDGQKKEMLKDSFIFETEIGMYRDVIPKFEAMLREIGDDTVLGCRCLYHSLKPVKVIIFEDLQPLGYTVLRERQVNLEEAKIAFAKLAKWHACSYKINQENSATLDVFCHGFMEQNFSKMRNFLEGGSALFIEMLNTQPSLIKYKPYFEVMQPTLIEKCRATYEEYREKHHPDSFYVLCHGDFHGKNLMFKRSMNTGKLEDVIFLDFQISCLGSPVTDIITAFYMLIDKQLRLHYKDELVRHYFGNFSDTLKRLGYTGKMPTLLQLRRMLLRHKHLEIFFLITVLPTWSYAQENIVEIDDVIGSSDYRKKFYKGKSFLAELEECLPNFLEMGFLECQ